MHYVLSPIIIQPPPINGLCLHPSSGVQVIGKYLHTVYNTQSIELSQKCIDGYGETHKLMLFFMLLCTPDVMVSSNC